MRAVQEVAQEAVHTVELEVQNADTQVNRWPLSKPLLRLVMLIIGALAGSSKGL